MSPEARFWEGAAACRDDAPQAALEAVLLHLREPEPAWGTIASLLTDERVKLWRSALTALRRRAVKAVASARAAGHLLADNPANAGMREGGWEPWHELVQRLVRQWGPAPTITEGTAKGKDGRPFPATFYAWSRIHPDTDGPQAGKPTRCVVVAHSTNPAWVRVSWASWREGLRASRASGVGLGVALGVEAADVFGAHPAPAPVAQALDAIGATVVPLGDRDLKPANVIVDDEDQAERAAIEAEA